MTSTFASYGFDTVFETRQHDMGPFSNAKSRTEVERIYRRLAKKAHPDVGGTNQQMYELNEARARALLCLPKDPAP